MEPILILALGAFVAYWITRARCLGNCFGCLIWFLIVAVLAAWLGVS